jgi:hypothetical protein
VADSGRGDWLGRGVGFAHGLWPLMDRRRHCDWGLDGLESKTTLNHFIDNSQSLIGLVDDKFEHIISVSSEISVRSVRRQSDLVNRI